MSTVISSTCVTLSFILLATVCTHFFFSCFVSPSHIPPHESIYAGTFPLYFLLSAVFLKQNFKKVTFVFFKHLILHICGSLVLVLFNFTFSIRRLSTHFSMTFDKLSEDLSWLSAFIFDFLSIFISFHIAFLHIFLRYISFVICATIILLSCSSFSVFQILLFPLVSLFLR